jgi:hypothetical protein
MAMIGMTVIAMAMIIRVAVRWAEFVGVTGHCYLELVFDSWYCFF